MPTRKSSSVLIMSLSSLLNRAGGLLTQVVMAWYLTPVDYGLYAIVLGITTLTTVMRGGGTSAFLGTMKPEEFRTLGGGMFRWATMFGVLGGVFTLGAVLPAQVIYDADKIHCLGWVLFYAAIQFLTFNLSTYPRAMAASQLRFNEIAVMDTCAMAMKFIVSFYCASHGYGAASFLFALIANNVVVIVWSLLICRVTWSDFAASPTWIQETVTLLKLPFVIAVVNSLGGQLDLFIASFFIPVASLGIYLFANQMAVQPIQLLSSTLQNVLAPYAARIRGSIDSENENIRQTFMTGIVFVPIFVMSVAAVYPSMAHLLFRERWDASILPVILSCVLLIYPTVQVLLEAPIMGARRWSLVLKLFCGRAISKCCGALLAVAVIYVFDIPSEYVATVLVLGVGAASTATSLFQIQVIAREVHLVPATFRYEIYSTPLYATLAAVATSGLANSVVELLNISSDSIRVEALIEFGFCFLAYTSVGFILLRFGYIDNLHHILVLFPKPVRAVLYKILVLEEPKSVSAHTDQTA